MENFIVSARKYRPLDFKSVVGQDSITATLKNSVKNKQLAHAYLFCGPRGVGKTTCARIFAKTINCENPTSDYEACNECESCLSFNEQRSYNIHELDAASNNSVEDIRNLIEQVRIPPQIGTHSVYIIDEVHMLSAQAFNAFLKTLEEPPGYAIFVLATTEKHKILPTILSRCQIFDFNRIKVNDSVNYLAYVAEKEGIDAEKDALNIIAQKSDGAMRDALSFFDQIVSFAGKNITYEATIENLNVLDYDYYFKLTDNFLSSDLSASLLSFNEILENGFDGHHFITGLASHFRDLLVCKDAQTVELLEVGSNIKQKYLQQSEKCSVQFLMKAIEIANKADLSYKGSKNKRLQVELALMQLCSIFQDQSSEKKKTTEPKQIKEKESNDRIVAEPKEEYSERKKNIPTKNQLKSSGISLNSNPEKEETQKKKEESEDMGEVTKSSSNDTIEQNDLNQAWAELTEKFVKQQRLYVALKANNPQMIDNRNAELKVTNKSLEQALVKLQSRIVSFLRKELQNSGFELNIQVETKNDNENSNFLYTDRDKYKYLVQKNPKLEDLKNTFDLDF